MSCDFDKVLIVAKCIVNNSDPIEDIKGALVLIVAKCIVNIKFNTFCPALFKY